MLSLRGRIFVAAAMFLFIAGCVEKVETITLNPDGSGKAVLDLKLTTPPAMGQDPKTPPPDPKMQAKAVVTSLVRGSKGVDAWKDVKYELLPDGRVHVMGTAYFPNIAAVEFANAGKNNLTWTKQADGSMLLLMTTGNPPDANAPKLSAEEAAKKAAEVKAQWQQQRPMMDAIFTSMKMDSTYLLPGKVSDVQVFQKVSGGVHYVIEGKKILAAMDKGMSDEAALAAALQAGRQPGQGASEEELNESLFGTKGKMQAKVTDLKPQFDYAAESAAAKAGQEQMIKALGLDTPPSAPTPSMN